MYSKICLTNGKIRLILIIQTCSAALFLAQQSSVAVQGLVLHPHQILFLAQTCLFTTAKGKTGLYSSRPSVWLYTPSVVFRDQAESSRCFTLWKIMFKKKIKKKSLLETAGFGLGAKGGRWGKKEIEAKNQTSAWLWWKTLCPAQLYLLLTRTTWTRNTIIKNNVPCRA